MRKRPKDLQVLKAKVDDQTILSELEKARELTKDKIYPTLILDYAMLARIAGKIKNISNPCISLFMYRDNLKPGVAVFAKVWCL